MTPRQTQLIGRQLNRLLNSFEEAVEELSWAGSQPPDGREGYQTARDRAKLAVVAYVEKAISNAREDC